MILFVAHEAKLTGAPVALLSLLRWLRRSSSLDVSVVVGTRCPLVERFAALAPVTTARECGPALLRRADLVCANSTASHRLIDVFDPFAAPVLIASADRSRLAPRTFTVFPALGACGAGPLGPRPRLSARPLSHVHELRAGLAPVDVLPAGKRPARYIAVSNQVREVLVTDYRMAPDEVTVCEGFVWTADVLAGARTPPADHDVWRHYGIPTGSRVVGAVGSIWRYKGPDLFAQLATSVLTGPHAPDGVHFVWIGGTDDRVPLMERWIDEAGLGHRVHVVGEVDQPYPLMAALDVFVLTSREDPFPLVLLEAGALARCAVAFDAGGASQVLAEGRGILIQPFDIEAMAAAVTDLLQDAGRRADIGARLAAHVRTEHDVERRAPEILKVIRQVLPA